MTTIKTEQQQIQKIVWFALLLSWILRYYQNLLLHDLYQAPFISVKADNIFWLYHALQIPQYILEHYHLSTLLDASWLLVCLGGLLSKERQWLGFLIFPLIFNYNIIYHSVATHHEHKLVGLLFCIPLLSIKTHKNFVLIFAGLRYYAIFALFSAAVWKLWRGSAGVSYQMSEILKHQHLDYLISYPNSYFSLFIRYLIDHTYISAIFWYSGWIIEFIFIIGFFSRKWDKVLGILLLLFFFMDYWLMNLYFVEFCIFVLFFYPWKDLWNYYETELK